MNNNLVVIKHIPHASLEFPDKYLESIDMSLVDFFRYNYKMSDIGVDKLFEDIKGITLKAKYSRLFCDVERYKDDYIEPMAKLGQGYRYTKFYDGTYIKRKKCKINWDLIKEKYYDEWHENFNNVVREAFDLGKEVLILDLHSYSDELANNLSKKGPYPDICIGINEDFNNQKLLEEIVLNIQSRGYTYKINYPYSGAIVPNAYIRGEIKGNLTSIMIEVNKRIYL